jgi:hypothetical protein
MLHKPQESKMLIGKVTLLIAIQNFLKGINQASNYTQSPLNAILKNG